MVKKKALQCPKNAPGLFLSLVKDIQIQFLKYRGQSVTNLVLAVRSRVFSLVPRLCLALCHLLFVSCYPVLEPCELISVQS